MRTCGLGYPIALPLGIGVFSPTSGIFPGNLDQFSAIAGGTALDAKPLVFGAALERLPLLAFGFWPLALTRDIIFSRNFCRIACLLMSFCG